MNYADMNIAQKLLTGLDQMNSTVDQRVSWLKLISRMSVYNDSKGMHQTYIFSDGSKLKAVCWMNMLHTYRYWKGY